ncbi:unnamed protein product [Amoebophrya sp. A120]|nr:unnamed protein product [Amoebophrya sp. A120]|eukprot:GSA120T00023458001.1
MLGHFARRTGAAARTTTSSALRNPVQAVACRGYNYVWIRDGVSICIFSSKEEQRQLRMRSVMRMNESKANPSRARVNLRSCGCVCPNRFAMSKPEVTKKLQNYHDQLLGTNWGDYLELVHNEPFLSAELESIADEMGPYMKDTELGPKYQYALQATDCMYACEDVRDHLNEILELMTRKTGVLGMGINAGEPVENLTEQAEMLNNEYEKLLKQYPDFKPKVEQSVGHGLAILRMKHKFAFSSGHRFFY